MNVFASRFIVLVALLVAFATACYGSSDMHGRYAASEKAKELIKLKDYEKAISLLHPISGDNFSTAYLYHEAHRLAGKKREYINAVRSAADSGNPHASYFLARALLDFYPYPKEPLEVEKYYMNAHKGGIAMATELLGHIYYGGLTSSAIQETTPRVPRNLEKAKGMFEICSHDAMVGASCIEGLGHVLLELNPDEPQIAIARFEKAKAYGTLWSMYYFGIGVPRDVRAAGSYREKVIELLRLEKSSRGQLSCYMKVRDSAAGLEKGDPKSLVDIAYGFYSSSTGKQATCFPANLRLHIELLERASSAGSMYALKELADYYLFGDVVPKDYVLSYMYSSILSVDGDQELRQKGMDRLKTLERLMSKNALEEAQARAREWRRNKALRKNGS